MKPKYLLCPGYVVSRNDGQKHYIGAKLLAQLYRVRMQDCLVAPDASQPGGQQRYDQLLAAAQMGEFVVLRPRYSGDYSLQS